MQKIKVLHIVKSLGRGGAETLLVETLKHHNKNVFEFHYLFFLSWKNELVKELEIQGAKVVNISASNNIKLLSKIFAVNKYIKDNQFQIVHCHLPWAGIVARLALLFNKKVKLIYSEHNIQERYHWLTKLLNKVTYKLQDHAIAVSKSVEVSIYKNISKSISTQVILNGVDTEKFSNNFEDSKKLKQNLGIKKDEIIIGNICVFRSQKRLKIWVDVFEKVNSKHPNTKGILVGAGILFEEIKEYIYSKKLENKIILTGLQTNAQAYFNVIDIYLLSSEFEGLPIALLEAMSMQCAPVVTNAGGVKEVIQHKVNGLMVNVNEPMKLIDQLNYYLENLGFLESIKTKCRITVVENFSVINTTHQIENLYKNILY